MTAVRSIPTEQVILGWFNSLSNCGRWGPAVIAPLKLANGTGSPVNPLAML